MKTSIALSIAALAATACGDNGSTAAPGPDAGLADAAPIIVDAGPACGDGTIDTAAGEQCELGDDNCDAACHFITFETFEGDVGAWMLDGGAEIVTNPATSSKALHLVTVAGTCGSSVAALTVTVPTSTASIRFDISGDVPSAGSNVQAWFTLGGFIGDLGPALPITDAVVHLNFCIDPSLVGAGRPLEFLLSRQNGGVPCDAMEAWIDNLELSASATDCVKMGLD